MLSAAFCASQAYRIGFTRESLLGRNRASKWIGAALPHERLKRFDRDFKNLLDQVGPRRFPRE